jgi:glycosyltransferase involved in cell wall biosynthesis
MVIGGEMQNLLFIVEGDKNWIGGVYYIRNIIFALRQIEKIDEKYKIYILLDREIEFVFEDMFKAGEAAKIYWNRNCSFFKKAENKILKAFCRLLRNRDFVPDLYKVIKKYKIDQIYPLNYPDSPWINKGICWIPDFQHIHYPQFFSKKELQRRGKSYEQLAKKHKKIVVSSKSAYQDYKNLYPLYTKNVYVIPFVSAIPERIQNLDNVLQVRKKYKLEKEYFLISNQFWKHKNHITVFRAIKRVKELYKRELLVVCTGLMSDYRNPEYCDSLKDYIRTNHLENNIRIVGFVGREEQIQLMKGCLAVIQPSLFEGWGTVVEDAKTLQKPIVMSDISVHYEQQIKGDIIFERNNHEELAEILVNLLDKPFNENDMKYSYIQTAKKYGKLFHDMLEA